MPSFFDGLKRMLTGQPVFRPGEDSDEAVRKNDNREDVEEKPEHPFTGQPIPQGPKPRPQAIVERVECRTSGPNMEITVHIQNMSNEQIMLDKILLLNSRHELDRQLRPGERAEFVNVYRGPRPNNRNYSNCEVQYQDSTGDYFSAIHNIQFKQEPDNTYVIDDIRFVPPVKDI